MLGAVFAALVVHFDQGSGLSPLRARIVAIAQWQIGSRKDPASTYCNKFSVYWTAGINDCGNDNLNEEWWPISRPVVTATTGDRAAPDVVNGDGDRTGYSVVELGDHQADADVKGKGRRFRATSRRWPRLPRPRRPDPSCLALAGQFRSGPQPPGVYPAGRAIDFISKKASRPSGPNSRPTPDSL